MSDDHWSYNRDQSSSWPLVSTIKLSYSRSLSKLRQNLDRRRLLPSGIPYKIRLSRALSHVKFVLVSAGSFFVAMSPWGLAVLEAVVMTLLFWSLCCSDKPWRHIQDYDFRESLLDIVLLSYLRFLAVLLAYLLGAGTRMMR